MKEDITSMEIMEMLMKFSDHMDMRFERIEQKFDTIDHRLISLENRMTGLGDRMTCIEAKLDTKVDKQDFNRLIAILERKVVIPTGQATQLLQRII